MRRVMIMGWAVPLMAAALVVSGCVARDDLAAPGGAPPGLEYEIPAAVSTGAAIADAANVPPPSQISPLGQTLADDVAIIRSFQALDIAREAADTILVLRPSFRGTPAANKLADGIDGARKWLNIASAAQRAGQADSYVAATEQAAAALNGVRDALATLKGQAR